MRPKDVDLAVDKPVAVGKTTEQVQPEQIGFCRFSPIATDQERRQPGMEALDANLPKEEQQKDRRMPWDVTTQLALCFFECLGRHFHVAAFERNLSQLALDMEPVSISGKLSSFDITLVLSETESQQALWRSLVRSYHYQGYKRMVGRSLKYTAYIKDTPIACLGWGSAAWSISPRDSYIGWEKATKDKKLFHIANNIRFLILPGVNIKYLASHLLAKNIKRIAGDWFYKYGITLYLLETFVEKRFSGTSYRAANWTYLGPTRGYSKKGARHLRHENIKDIYVYPLVKDFRQRLSS